MPAQIIMLPPWPPCVTTKTIYLPSLQFQHQLSSSSFFPPPLSLSKNLPPVSQSAKLPPPMTNLAHPLQMQTSKFTHNTRARRCEAPTLLIATYCSSWGRKTNLPINVRISKICQIPAGKTGTDQYCRYLDWSAILFYLFRIVPKSLCFVLYQPTW